MEREFARGARQFGIAVNAWRVTRPKFGDGIGLHRVAAVAELAGLNLARWREASANIAGSSGKGSTAAMLAACLSAAGVRTGRFTSPHMLRLNERFAIDGVDVSDAALAPAWARIDAAVNAYEARHGDDRVGGFEFLYLVACALFEDAGVEFAVMECGIGGRFDPTRASRTRRAALTSVSMEHVALLGPSLEHIAYNKLDTCAPGGRIYIGESAAPLEARIRAYCGLCDIEPVFLRAGPDWRMEGSGLSIGLGGARMVRADLALAGAHQHNNAALAARLADDVLAARAIAPEARAGAIAHGLAQVRWPGRLELVCDDPPAVIDVGHTPAAAAAAGAAFAALYPQRPRILVCGASLDKDSGAIMAALGAGFDIAIATQARHKGAPADAIAEFLRAAHPGLDLRVCGEVEAARALAFSLARAAGAAVLAAGGLFLAAEFKAGLLGLDAGALEFF